MIDLIEVSRNAAAQFFKDDVRSEEPANASFVGGFPRQRLSRLPPVEQVPCPPAKRGNQEQTQIIATAIGKPKAKATAIVAVNAESKFTSGCTLSSSDMALLHGSAGQKAVTGTKRRRLLARTHVSRRDGAMVLGHG
jgi:hypothetical protein